MVRLRQEWKRFITWYQSVGRGVQIGIGCGALIVVCVICGGVIGALGSGASGNVTAGNSSLGGNSSVHRASTATSVPLATVIHPTATAHARATATPSPSGDVPILGGSGQAFIAQYGPLTSQSNTTQGDLHFRQYPGVAQDYLIVDEGKYYGVTPGDANAYSILVAPPPGQSWSLTSAKQVCEGFMPTDARFVKRVVTTGSQGVDGWDDIYMSASLAKIFPTSAFQDASQNPAPDGSFDIMYLYASTSDTTHAGSCSLTVGEQQTQG